MKKDTNGTGQTVPLDSTGWKQAVIFFNSAVYGGLAGIGIITLIGPTGILVLIPLGYLSVWCANECRKIDASNDSSQSEAAEPIE